MTENELARALFGRRERDARESGGTTVTVTATATADSSGGMVPVDFGTDIIGDDKVADPDTGEVVYAPPSQSVEVPVAGGVSAGDTVSVLIVDGTPVQAIGTGSVDRVGVVAEGARTTANEAKRVAEATGQHFWHDTRGAHVTEEEREDYETQASGFQQLMTSIGSLLTRAVAGVEYLLRSDTASGTVIYDGTVAADDPDLSEHALARFASSGSFIGTRGKRVITNTNGTILEDGNYVQGLTGEIFVGKRLFLNSSGINLTDEDQWAGRSEFFVRSENVSSMEGRMVLGLANDDTEKNYTYKVNIGSGDASGENSISIGDVAEASGDGAVSVNGNASGKYSVSIGNYSSASGDAAFAIGTYAAAKSDYQTAIGRSNIYDDQDEYAVIVGNGQGNNNRSNAHTLDWNGNGWYQGDVSCGGTSGDAPAHSLAGKQDQLTAGTGITIDANNVISAPNAFSIDAVYPVGSIYMNVNATDPSTLFPNTTWARISEGRVLIGQGSYTDGNNEVRTFANGISGGEYSHALVTGETPLRNHHHGLNNHTHGMSHTHKLSECRTNVEASGYGLTVTGGFSNRVLIDQGTASKQRSTQGSSAANTGGSTANTTDTSDSSNITAHNNIQPYFVVYMWRRVS